nr:RNA-directed DNA polymerase, eukaryota [Tanacetum cinerariifolium]
MSKSKIIGVLVDREKIRCAAAKLECLILKLPFSYLGTQVGGTMSRVQAWNDVVDKVQTRLSKWKLNTLSIGGRLTLLKSVLGSIPLFHMSIFRVPLGVLRMLESTRSHFFNGHVPKSKKASWVKWNNVMASKEKGGLGVASLYALNRGMKLESTGLDSSFHRKPRGGIEQEQFDALADQIRDVILASTPDRWVWSLKKSGVFSVASIRKMIDDKRLPKVTTKTRWIKVVPIKVNVHAWKVKNDYLPTGFNISRRGIYIASIMCPFCSNGVETLSHLFFSCNLARTLTRRIIQWWDIFDEEFNAYEEWLSWIVNIRLPSKKNMMLEEPFIGVVFIVKPRLVGTSG